MIKVNSPEDVSKVRLAVRSAAKDAGLGLVDLTKYVTAVSELARNMLVHAGGGEVTWEKVRNGRRTGLKTIFSDRGPGMNDTEIALQDGYTTGDGLGLGLGGAKRLVNEFSIDSKPDEGTTICIIRWARR
jgi:serine/threonine-protein kinase RsbT